MTNKDDVQIQAVLRHQNSKAHHSVPKEAEEYLAEARTGTEHQILQQAHHQSRNHRQMQNVPYQARNYGTHLC